MTKAVLRRQTVRSLALLLIAACLGGGVSYASSDALGEWSEVIAWPFVPTSAAQRPDGRIVTWASNEVDAFPIRDLYTHSGVFNPRDGTFVSQPNPHHDMFCAGTAMLGDGSLLVAGGNPSLRQTSRFDGANWQVEPPMAQPRWYGTLVTLADGDAFATFGKGASQIGERWGENVGWTDLPRASMATLSREQNVINSVGGIGAAAQWFGFMHLAPNGRVFHAGPTPTMNWFDTDGLGGVTSAGSRNGESVLRQFGSSVLYDDGQLLITGGADPRQRPASTASALTVDISGSAPVVQSVDDMRWRRTFHNSVVLPNGEVLVIGGNENGVQFNDAKSILTPESWDPDTRRWRALAAHTVPRNYHSVAVLLKDGRVLSAGGGLCGANCPANHADAEIFSPPYLFSANGDAAVRPEIAFASARTRAAGNIFVETDADIESFNLVRLGSTTHSINSDQRFLPLAATRAENGVYELSAHSNPNVLVPGFWWLFAVDSAGVPALGHTVEVGLGQAATLPPLISDIPDQVVASGTEWVLDLTDYSSGAEAWGVTGLPAGLSAVGSAIRGIPSTTGLHSVSVYAEANGRSSHRSFSLEVVRGSGVTPAGDSVRSGGSLDALGLALLLLAGRARWRQVA